MNITESLSFLDFTTKERIKIQNGIDDDRSQDVLLDQMITTVSGQFVAYMGLHALAATHTEVYEIRQHKKVLSLDAKPITSVVSLKHSSRDLSEADWTAHTDVDSTLWSLSKAGGWLRLNFDTSFDPNYFQVVYVGGLGTDTEAILGAFPDLVHACDMQVQYLFTRWKKLGGNVSTRDGAQTQYEGQYQLLRAVTDILDMHRRAGV